MSHFFGSKVIQQHVLLKVYESFWKKGSTKLKVSLLIIEYTAHQPTFKIGRTLGAHYGFLVGVRL